MSTLFDDIIERGSTYTKEKGEFAAGVARGIDTTQATGYGFIQTMGELFGSDTVSEWAKDGVEEQLRQAAANPAKVSSYKDIGSFSDFGDYVAGALGEQVPNLLTIAGGGVAGVSAKAALGKTVAKQLTNASSKRAAALGAGSTTYPLVTGETQLELNEAGVSNPLLALATGTAKTALELGPLAKLVNKVTKVSKQAKTATDVFKQAGETLAKQSGLEGITEGAQTILDKMAVSSQTGDDVLSEDNLHEIFDSILKGGIVGGAMGGGAQFVSSVYNGDFEPTQEPPKLGYTPEDTGPNDPPVPSSEEEINFSANAFLDGRQEGYIQTAGESVPDSIVADPSVQSVEITPEMSNDPQLEGAVLHFKDPKALETLKQGSGLVQNYGTASKPEINENTRQDIVGIRPVDKDGNKGSPILVNRNDVESYASVFQAQQERAGEGGAVDLLEPEQLEQVINARKNEIQATLGELEANAENSPNTNDVLNKIDTTPEEQAPTNVFEQILFDTERKNSDALNAKRAELQEQADREVDGHELKNPDDTIEVKGERVSVEKYRKKSVEKATKPKQTVNHAKGVINYGNRETTYKKDGTPHALQEQWVDLPRLTSSMLDVTRNIDQGSGKNTERSTAGRYLNAVNEALSSLVTEKQMPNEAVKSIQKADGKEGRPLIAVARIDGRYFTHRELVEMVSDENRPKPQGVKSKATANDIEHVEQNILIAESKGDTQTAERLKGVRKRLLEQQNTYEQEEESTREFYRNEDQEDRSYLSLSENSHVENPHTEKALQLSKQLDNIDSEIEEASASGQKLKLKRLKSLRAKKQASLDKQEQKEADGFYLPEGVKGKKRTLDVYQVKDPLQGPANKPKEQIAIEEELSEIRGVKRSKGITEEEHSFVANLQNSIGNETPVLLISESDLPGLEKAVKNKKFFMPIQRIRNAVSDIKEGNTNGQYVPMGNFAAVVVKDFHGKQATPKQVANRAMVIAHEVGHMLYNTRYDKLPAREKARLKEAHEKQKETGQKDFEEWFSDQVAATARDLLNDKKPSTNDKGILDFAKKLLDKLREIFNAATEGLSQRFKTDAQFKRFMSTAIKRGFFEGKDDVGFGEHKNFGKEDFKKAGERAAKLRHNPVVNRAFRHASALFRTADHELRRLGPTGEAIANIFHNRATSNDRTHSTTHETVNTQYRPGQQYKEGDRVYFDGRIYTVKKGHKTGSSPTSLNKDLLRGVHRASLSSVTKGLKGWLEARQQMSSFWKKQFVDLMPKGMNEEQINEWLQKNVIENQSPEYKALMEKFWVYANSRMGGKLGKIEDYMPRIYNIDAIQNNPDGFKDVLRKNLKYYKGKNLVDFSTGEHNDLLDSIVNNLIANNGAVLDELYLDNSFKNTRDDHKKKRTLLNIPEEELTEFMAPPADRLAAYIEATVKRAELETRTGGYDNIIELFRKLRQQREQQVYVDDEYFHAIKDKVEKYKNDIKAWNEKTAEMEEKLKGMDISTPAFVTYESALAHHISNKPELPVYWNPNGYLDSLFDGLEKTQPNEVRKVRHIIDGYMGRLGLDMAPETRKIQQYLMALQYYTTLSFAAISSITDLGNILIRAKTSNLTELFRNSKVLVQGFKDRNTLEAAAAALGVAQHDTIMTIFTEQYGGQFTDPKVKKANDFFFKAIGLEWLTKTTRTMSMSMAKEFIRQNGENPGKHSDRHLSELGLTQSDVKAWIAEGQPMTFKMGDGRVDMNEPTNKVAAAITQFADESILMPNAAMRPTWGSDLGFFKQLIWQLKSFMWAFGHQVIGGVYREIKARNQSGDSIPAQVYMTALAGAPLLGLAALGLELKEFIKYGDFSKGASADMGMAEYTVDLYDRAGGFGPFGMVLGIMQAEEFGRSGLVSLLGPTAEHLDLFFSDFSRGVNRSIPYVSQTNGKLLGYDIPTF